MRQLCKIHVTIDRSGGRRRRTDGGVAPSYREHATGRAVEKGGPGAGRVRPGRIDRGRARSMPRPRGHSSPQFNGRDQLDASR